MTIKRHYDAIMAEEKIVKVKNSTSAAELGKNMDLKIERMYYQSC